MKETQGRCPLCGSPIRDGEVDEAAVLRAQILRLRQRLDELERADISSQGAEAEQLDRDQAQSGLADREQLQERIDRGLQHLEGGYGTEDRP
jgi:DNA repair exonuclease SbcCD ATPase subunit